MAAAVRLSLEQLKQKGSCHMNVFLHARLKLKPFSHVDSRLTISVPRQVGFQRDGNEQGLERRPFRNFPIA
jgi:hypothetical protein